ncbi:MAG: (2Fe-2S)-binding protein [Pyrinomonadaceae bacterium]|nr:(2Fe-2S)-binding protein [Pyrinomonadaceae bacterium]
MSTRVETRTPFEGFLRQYDESDWAETLISLLPDIHEVDRAATQIWFAFYPLALHRALCGAEDPEAFARKLLMQGKYHLLDQIDSSHTFLYGHRFWTEAKRAVEDYAASFQSSTEKKLTDAIREAARAAAAAAKADESLLVGITAIAFMTVEQTGLAAFKEAPGRLHIDVKHARLSPEQVLKARAKDDSQGLFGFLRTVDKEWTVTFDENTDGACFKLINGQDLAWAAAADKRDYKQRDERRIEGPIPVECRNASCGTCWVGVLGGAEKLAPVSARERRMMREFGYLDTDEERPLIRLACITPASGAVSIVIPPWNGFFGKRLKSTDSAGEADTRETEVSA